jgi:hypothetical protein
MRKLRNSIVAVVSGAALFTAGVALASNPNHPNHGSGTTTTTTTAAVTTTGTTSTTTPSPNAKAYGYLCQWASKKHIAGQKGTPFSQCVLAMAKAAHGASGKAACAALSKKHVAGEKGTLFSRCVSAAAKLNGSH